VLAWCGEEKNEVENGNAQTLLLGCADLLCLGSFMILLDTTIVNNALPSMVSSFGASVDQMLWVLDAGKKSCLCCTRGFERRAPPSGT